jgi:hypothetical protein
MRHGRALAHEAFLLCFLQQDKVQSRLFRQALNLYTMDFLATSAAKLVQMEDTDQSMARKGYQRTPFLLGDA